MDDTHFHDAELLERCAKGELDAFDTFVDRDLAEAVQIAAAWAPTSGEAEDAVHNAFEHVFNTAINRDAEPRIRLFQFLLRNVCGQSWAPRCDCGAMTSEEHRVLVLREVAELSYEDIGAILERSKENVQELLHTARKRWVDSNQQEHAKVHV